MKDYFYQQYEQMALENQTKSEEESKNSTEEQPKKPMKTINIPDYAHMPTLKLNYSSGTGQFLFDNRTQSDKDQKVRSIFGTQKSHVIDVGNVTVKINRPGTFGVTVIPPNTTDGDKTPKTEGNEQTEQEKAEQVIKDRIAAYKEQAEKE